MSSKGRDWPDSNPSAPSAGFEPYRANTWEIATEAVLNSAGTERLVMRDWRDESNGALSDFIAAQETYDSIQGEWREVARIDVRHGDAHIHRYNSHRGEPDKPRPLYPCTSREDLEEANKMAESYLRDHWEENLRRWRVQ